MHKERLYLIYGTMLTLAIFTILFALKLCMPSLLDIDAKWLAVAILPIIIVLIMLGYIKKVSAFGMEFEIAAKDPISDLPGIIEFVRPTFIKEKGSVNNLNYLSQDEIENTNALSFILKRNTNYNIDDVRVYLRRLPNVRFLVLINPNNEFFGLTMIGRSAFFYEPEFLEEFINEIQYGINDFKRLNLTTSYVYSNATIIFALTTMREYGIEFIPVVDKSKKIIGVVFKQTLEKYLADLVIARINKMKN